MSATQEEECNGEWMSHWVADILVRFDGRIGLRTSLSAFFNPFDLPLNVQESPKVYTRRSAS